MVEKTLTVRAIEPAQAAQALRGLAGMDPLGIMEQRDIEDMAARGQCFEVAAGQARAVYVLKVEHGIASVEAAAGQGHGIDMVEVLDGVICAQAQGLREVTCQTARPGLLRKLKRHGWELRGYIIGKKLA